MKALAVLVAAGAFCVSFGQKALDEKLEPLMVRLRAANTNYDLMMSQITTEKQAQNTYKQYMGAIRAVADDAGAFESMATDKGTKCRFAIVYFQAMANYLGDPTQVEKVALNIVEKYRDQEALCVPIEQVLFLNFLGIDKYKKIEKELLKSKNQEVLGSVALAKELIGFMDEKGDLNRLRQVSVTYAKTKAGARAKRIFDLRTKLILSQPAPSYELAFSDGRKVNLADLKGKITIVHFWGFWCGQEISDYKDLLLRNAARIQVIGVNTDAWNPAYIGARIKDKQIWWPNHLAGSLMGTVPMDFGFLSFPSTLIIDEMGIVRSVPGVGNWREVMDRLLGNS